MVYCGKRLGKFKLIFLFCWLSVKFFITAEYPDLWPLVVDELLRVIADLAESVQDFISATESSSSSHQGK